MEGPQLDVNLHINYWKRCLRSLLPTYYTGSDSSRMTLGFFILSALDLLGENTETLPEKEREAIRDWILKCQHPNGGFCGSTNHRFPDIYYVDVGHGRELMDPANLPATFFAIMSLSFVGSLNQVKRVQCLKWLRTLQREDGSFGELVTKEGKIEGGSDMRYCCVAVAIRWILRGEEAELQEADIDMEKLVHYLRSAQVRFNHDSLARVLTKIDL
jgi:geranylgeranyl transferase type-1 subunit beta